MNLSSRVARTAVVLALLGTTLLAQSSLKYPQPRKGDVVDDYFGTKIADPYRWMEDLNATDVKQWIDAENAITARYLDSLPVRDALKKRITDLYNYPRVSVPYFESRATPTTSTRSRPKPNVRPIAPPPGQRRFASVSFTTATFCDFASSCSTNARPVRIRMPTTSK